MKRRLTVDGPDIRAERIAWYRDLELRYGSIGGCPFGPRADRLERGEAMRFRGSELGPVSLKATGFTVHDDLVLEPDGMVALLSRHEVGGTVRFFRADGSEVC